MERGRADNDRQSTKITSLAYTFIRHHVLTGTRGTIIETLDKRLTGELGASRDHVTALLLPTGESLGQAVHYI